ncbi:MAG: enoyl-CoA hydratase-related protein, partial [Candidatus Nanopelagicales bacterium]|nr:enoyl-CoA hydratase-related protein [Candidatus Nanopelagicales bacterium]
MTDTNQPGATLELIDNIALVTIDDGKANALSYRLIDAVDQALTDAERRGRAIVIAGRPGAFCAGFDLAEVSQGMDRASAIIGRGGELIRRVFECPLPVVVAATGHAVAGGAVLLLVSDVRIGADGPWRI